MQNEDFERQRILIEGENVNVSETNVLKELLQIAINILAFIIVTYLLIFIISGIAIKSLSIEKQIALEDFMSKIINEKEIENIEGDETKKINYIKNKILEYDKTFSKTSKLNIKIIKNKRPNALCLPNGNIYITSSLYNKIKNQDDMLFFVIAHEMGHYKNKDHIMNLRKNIASSSVLFIIALSGSSGKDLYKIVEGAINLTDLNYSRSVEARADKYAGRLLLKEYGNTSGGIKALEMLSNKKYPRAFSIFSDHPTIERRIKVLKRLNKLYTS